jgi:hypothetical protein
VSAVAPIAGKSPPTDKPRTGGLLVFVDVLRVGSIVVGIMLVTALAACDDSPASGDGDVTTETRVVEEFSSVRVSNGPKVFLTVDPAATGEVDLAVTTDSNLLEFVTTEVSRATLRVSIDSDGEITSTQGFEITGTVETLREVEAINGGEATITASVTAINLKAINAGRINGEALQAADVEVEADNGARITVCATGTVSGDVTNGANLIVLCGGDTSGVETSNGGTVSTS